MQSADRYKVCCVHPGHLGALWKECGPLLLRGQLECTKGDMKRALLELCKDLEHAHLGKVQVWVIIDDQDKRMVSAFLTRIVEGDDGNKALWVEGMAGERILAWGKVASARMVQFAKDENCTHVRGVGRLALLKAYEQAKAVEKRPDGLIVYERAVQ